MKISVTIELHGIEWSTIVSKESPVDAGAANAMIEKSVWLTQHVVRFLDTYVEWVHRTAFVLGVAISTLTVEIVGHVVSRSRTGVSNEVSACERRKRKSCRKASV